MGGSGLRLDADCPTPRHVALPDVVHQEVTWKSTGSPQLRFTYAQAEACAGRGPLNPPKPDDPVWSTDVETIVGLWEPEAATGLDSARSQSLLRCVRDEATGIAPPQFLPNESLVEAAAGEPTDARVSWLDWWLRALSSWVSDHTLLAPPEATESLPELVRHLEGLPENSARLHALLGLVSGPLDLRDSDEDGLPAVLELQAGSSDDVQDTDGDGVTDLVAWFSPPHASTLRDGRWQCSGRRGEGHGAWWEATPTGPRPWQVQARDLEARVVRGTHRTMRVWRDGGAVDAACAVVGGYVLLGERPPTPELLHALATEGSSLLEPSLVYMSDSTYVSDDAIHLGQPERRWAAATGRYDVLAALLLILADSDFLGVPVNSESVNAELRSRFGDEVMVVQLRGEVGERP